MFILVNSSYLLITYFFYISLFHFRFLKSLIKSRHSEGVDLDFVVYCWVCATMSLGNMILHGKWHQAANSETHSNSLFNHMFFNFAQ